MAKRKSSAISETEGRSISVKGDKRSSRKISKRRPKTDEVEVPLEMDDLDVLVEEEETEGHEKLLAVGVKKTQKAKEDSELSFTGSPIPPAEAAQKWPLRYVYKNKGKKDLFGDAGEYEHTQAKCHYRKATVDGIAYSLGDNAYVKAEDGQLDYIARIIELFEGTDRKSYFTAQWFYRTEDTVIKDQAKPTENRRVFLSEIKDDNLLECIVSKVNIVRVKPNMDLVEKEKTIPPCDLYYDMKYTVPFLTFETIKDENVDCNSGSSSTISSLIDSDKIVDDSTNEKASGTCNGKKTELHLLDLYSGCGAMSTGLCMGAALSNIKLVTKWAVDINPNACESLRNNHPETEVRNEAAEDFLSLLKEWENLCRRFSLFGSGNSNEPIPDFEKNEENTEKEVEKEEQDEDGNDDDEDGSNSEIFEVEKLLEVCYGDPNKIKKRGLYFKVRWLGYGPEEDTWEPIDGLSDCPEKLKEFVTEGFRSCILPLPGTVDFICGGPPCQGISGFNRFRNKDAPLKDPKNHQMVVYMDIVEHLKPTFVLMENVVDILKFAGGCLGRYALGRLISQNYQARLGMMAAGSYGLPQFRMRVFLWGAQPFECLPQYPLPTHEVQNKGVIPKEFEEICVAYAKDDPCELGAALTLKDAVADLPVVLNDESRDEMEYGMKPKTEFQKYIRLRREEIVGLTASKTIPNHQVLHDHRPLKLNEDDYQRVIQIPKKKGANFRDLPGLRVGPNNKIERDPTMEKILLPSNKPLVPEYAIKFVRGTSTKPFGRLWWDEIIATVVTRAEPHNQAVLHPEQDRVLTIREYARLQGFLDCYKLYGSVKERYIQIGNAVAVPVALALGYSLGLASQGLSNGEPLITLPFKFPKCIERPTPAEIEADDSC